MPSTITHGYIGLDTVKKLHQKPKKVLERHINNFKVYCQSTDILYFYHILLLKSNKIQKLGHYFHSNNVYKSFEYLINLNKKNQDEELFTFISGLITHYKADSIMHPYINYLSNNKNKLHHQDKHFEIETYLDNYFVKKYEKIDPKEHKHYKLIFNYKEEKVITDSLNKMFKDIFNEDNIGNIYYKSLKEMHFVFKYIRYDKTGLKRKLYQLIDCNPLKVRRTKYLSYHFDLTNDNYYLNLEKREWYNIKKKSLKSNKSFLELYEDVTNEASKIINELYLYVFEDKRIDLYQLIGNNSYSTGLDLDKDYK